MAVNKSSCIPTLNLQINQGSEKHSVTLTSNNADHDVFTVQNLSDYIEENLGVPVKKQKLIHKGESLQDMSATLSSYGVGHGSKIMLIGRKLVLEDDPNYKLLIKTDDAVDNLQKQFCVLLEDFDGIKQEYLIKDLPEESVKKLIKKTQGIIVEYMKKLELIDSLEVDVSLRNRRKNLVLKIQSMITKADQFLEELEDKQLVLEDDPNYKLLIKTDDAVDILQKQFCVLLEDFDGIKQGYLRKDLAEESVKKLIKKTQGIVEEYMKKLELIDSLEVRISLRNRRENLVLKIQSMITKADQFLEELEDKQISRMAVNQSTCVPTLNLQINQGSEKHSVTLTSNNADDDVFTVQNLSDYIEENLGVPVKAQRLIHKGKSLQDMSATLSSYGVRHGSKIMLIGRKLILEDDPNYKMLIKTDDAVDILQKQFCVLLEDFDGIKQGYLRKDLAEESVKKLIKKTQGIIEEYMKKLELIDSLEVDVSLRNRRKNLVLKIQSMITKADRFLEELEEYSLKGEKGC